MGFTRIQVLIGVIVTVVIGFIVLQFDGRNESASTGLYGRVELITGNCMPTIFVPGQLQEPGQNPCKHELVSRKIYVRKPLTQEEFEGHEPLGIIKKLLVVKTTQSKEDGSYRIGLPPGTYTVTVENEGGEFCNEFSYDNIMCKVEVGNSWSEYNIRIFLASF